MEKYKNYLYYKGEKEAPFTDGRAEWWKIESYAFHANDEKKPNLLSEKMCAFLRERHWQSDSGIGTNTWEEALIKAHDIYIKGLWSSSYIINKDTPKSMLY